MRRFCQLIGLRPEKREEYVRYHADVWPGVLATIEACHIRNYSIYLHNEVLIAYFEYHGTDFESDMQRMAADPETQRWWAIMDPMQQPLPGSGSQRWLDVSEVFHFDGKRIAGSSDDTQTSTNGENA